MISEFIVQPKEGDWRVNSLLWGNPSPKPGSKFELAECRECWNPSALLKKIDEKDEWFANVMAKSIRKGEAVFRRLLPIQLSEDEVRWLGLYICEQKRLESKGRQALGFLQ